MVVSPPYFPSLPLAYRPASLSAAHKSQQAHVPMLTSGGLDLSLILVSIASSLYLSTHASMPSGSTSSSFATSAALVKAAGERLNPVAETPSIEYETTIHRRCAYIPQRARPLTLSSEGRLLICRRERSVGVWVLEEVPKGSSRGQRAKGEATVKVNGRVRDDLDEDDDGDASEDESEVEETDGWRKVLEMDLKVRLPSCLVAPSYGR